MSSPFERRDRIQLVRSLTGEPLNLARRRLPAGADRPLIPDAEPVQAALEARLFVAWGFCSYPTQGRPLLDGEARHPYKPFGIEYLQPRPGELQLRLHPRMLAHFIGAVLPWAEPGDAEVRGIVGLRAEAHATHVVLARPGRNGRIVIRCSRQEWNRAITRALNEADGLTPDMLLWMSRPDGWTERELLDLEAFPSVHNPGRHVSSVLSALLRRSHVLYSRHAYSRFWHMWMSLADEICIEWCGGPTHETALRALLHPEAAPPLRLEDPSWRCTCSQTAGTLNSCYWCTLTGPGGITLHLRRAYRWGPGEHTAALDRHFAPRSVAH